jgi:hypothetical protein
MIRHKAVLGREASGLFSQVHVFIKIHKVPRSTRIELACEGRGILARQCLLQDR